jgi:hypothetical protein
MSISIRSLSEFYLHKFQTLLGRYNIIGHRANSFHFIGVLEVSIPDVHLEGGERTLVAERVHFVLTCLE